MQCPRHRGPQPHHPQETPPPPQYPHPWGTSPPLRQDSSPGGPPPGNPSAAAPAQRRLLPTAPARPLRVVKTESPATARTWRQPWAWLLRRQPSPASIFRGCISKSEASSRPRPSALLSDFGRSPTPPPHLSPPAPAPLSPPGSLGVRVGNPLGKPPGSSWRRGSGVAGSRGGGKEPGTPLFKPPPPRARDRAWPSMERGRALLLPLLLGLLQPGRGELGGAADARAEVGEVMGDPT